MKSTITNMAFPYRAIFTGRMRPMRQSGRVDVVNRYDDLWRESEATKAKWNAEADKRAKRDAKIRAMVALTTT